MIDLATANYGDNSVSILLGKGNGEFEKQVNFQVQNNPSGIIVGDFNTDGKLDLAVANSNV